MKYIEQLLDAAVDAGEFEDLVSEIADLLWHTITDFPERGGLPTVEEVTIDGEVQVPVDAFVLVTWSALERAIRAALDRTL